MIPANNARSGSPAATHRPDRLQGSAEPVDVSVLVPVLNEEAHLAEALAAMQGQDFKGQIEFLLIDGGSSDRTRDLVTAAARTDPRIRLLTNPARRTPQALNIGLREARGEFIARMDAHTNYPPRYLADGVDRLRRGDVAWVAGPQLAAGDGKWSRRVAIALASRLGTGGASFRLNQSAERETDTGFTGVWRRSLLEHLGGWDEGWPTNQDAELAARVRKDGGRIVCVPEMAAIYIPRNSLRALARQYWQYGTYRAKTSRRHPESLRRSNLLPPVLAMTVVGFVAGPRPVRRIAAVPLTFYAVAVLSASAASRRAAGVRDAMAMPAVFATMHLAWGFGFLNGCRRFGPPLASVRRILGLRAQS